MTSNRFQRIAIVNRGEAAMRLIHAVREYNAEHDAGLTTIALYTDPERRAMFVREADEAHCIGPASFVDAKDGQRKNAYLNYAAIEEALIATRAQAVWVGWGFVAEHPDFADLCEKKLALTFLGPDGDSLSVVLDGEPRKVRIFGIDAPEARQPWSRRARRALEALALGEEVRVVEVDRDAYGRIVAEVFAGEQCVGCELVRGGHAWVYRQFTDDRALLRLESEARKSGTGLWSLPESERIPPWEWRRRRPGATSE